MRKGRDGMKGYEGKRVFLRSAFFPSYSNSIVLNNLITPYIGPSPSPISPPFLFPRGSRLYFMRIGQLGWLFRLQSENEHKTMTGVGRMRKKGFYSFQRGVNHCIHWKEPTIDAAKLRLLLSQELQDHFILS